MGAAYVLSIFSSLAFLGITGEDAAHPSVGLTVAAVAGLWTGFLLAELRAWRRKGAGRFAEDYGLRIERSDIGLGIGAGLVSQFALLPLLYLPLHLHDLGKENKDLVHNTHGFGVVVLFLVLAGGAPVAEEVFFRGFLQPALLRRLGPAAGIGVAALVFGATHFDLAALPGLVLVGVVLGTLAHRRGRLGPSIVAHMVFNVIAVVAYLGS